MKTGIALFVLLSSLLASSWELVWQDDFDSDTIDTQKWDWDTAGNVYGWGNNEDQYYTYNHSQNSRIENGSLILEAHREPIGGKEYSSARLRTKERASWLYGRFEIRAKLPGGKGTWPAFWMLPEEDFYGNWPNSGEIDIMEYVGYDPSTIHTTIHTETLNHTLGTQEGATISVTDVVSQFHLYSVEWYPDSLSFFVDSQHVFSYVPQSKEKEVWPFNKPFHLLLNLAIGGDWGALQGIDTTIFPVQYEIDYVRAYREIPSQIKLETISYGNGTVTLSPQKEFYQIGDTVTITAVPESGYELRSWSGSSNSNESQFTVVVQSHGSYAASFQPEGELVQNGTFEHGFESWDTVISAGTATFTSDSTSATVSVTAMGTNSWDIALVQYGISLLQGEEYTLSVTANSPDSLSLIMGVAEEGGAWNLYADKSITLNKTKETFNLTFTADTTDPDARLFFDCGKSSGTILIESVSFKKSSDVAIQSGKYEHSVPYIILRKNSFAIVSHQRSFLSFDLYDIRGREIIASQKVISGDLVSLKQWNLGSGVYYVKLRGDTELLGTFPVMVQ